MTRVTFICEISPNQLEVNESIWYDEKLIELKIYCLATETFKNVNLTIKDAERLMDELHKSIMIAEGGKHE